MPMTPLERAARALAERRGQMLYENGASNKVASQYADERWRDHVADARAVLTAIREPSEVMVREIFDKWGEPASAADMDEIATAMWCAGIDAALAEEG